MITRSFYRLTEPGLPTTQLPTHPRIYSSNITWHNMAELSNQNIGQVSAIILAGGKSSRMGTDKALLQFGKETLLERLVRVVDSLVGRIVIMLSQTQQLPDKLKLSPQKTSIGRDRLREQGPLQGIADAFSSLPGDSEFIFVLSCDLPFVTACWLAKLLSEISRNDRLDAVCTQQEDYLNPLISIYRYQTLKNSQALLNQGKRSCQALLDNKNVLPLKPDDSEVIANINTPAEYQQALQRLKTNHFS